MQRLKTKRNVAYLDHIGRRRLITKTKYFRRNLHLNNRDLGISILRIKNKQQFFEETKGLKEMDPNVCFFIYHIYYEDLTNWLLSSKDREVIITDSLTNKIIGFNNDVKNYPDFVNVWIVKQQTSAIQNFKIGDVLFTR